MTRLNVKYRGIDEVVPYANNPRINDGAVSAVANSIREFGFQNPIIVDESGVVICGHTRLKAARRLGMNEVPTVTATGLTEDQIRAYRLADNKTGEIAEWDIGRLTLELENIELDMLQFGFMDIDLPGYEEPQPAKDPGAQIDKAEELREKWGTEAGQLWQIPSRSMPGREHRLLCGDSTSVSDVERLMAGERAVLFATDPPYAVAYDGTNHPTNAQSRPSKNKDWSESYKDWDKLGASAAEALYDGFCQVARDVAIADEAAWYCWHASVNVRLVFGAWEKAGAFVHQQIIWVKSRPILGRSWYMWQHEPCLFGWVSPHKPKRTAEDSPRTVWEIESFSQKEKPEHPTPKPLEIFAIPMRQHTEPGDICYEPFSGSGSQQAAGEQIGRLVYGLEQEPRYVAVILERLQGMGLEPALTE